MHPAATVDLRPGTPLRVDDARYRAIVEEQSELICRFLPDGRLTFFNEAFVRYFGMTREQLSGTSIFALMTEENIVRQKEFMAQLTVDRPVGEIETGGVMSDGRLRCRHWTNRAIFDDGGRLLEFQAVGHDITDRKLAEQALRDSEEKLRAIVNTATDGIISIDTEGIIESCNPAAEGMFGYAAGEVIGRDIEILMPEPYRGAHAGYLAGYLDGGKKGVIGIGREVVARRKDGTTFPIDLAVSEARLGERRLFTGIIRDITERKRIEEKVRQDEAQLAHLSRLAMLGEMAAGLAHDLNQPLSAIMNFAEACKQRLRRNDLDPATLFRTMENISAMAERAGEIVHGLRNLGQKGEPRRARIDLNQVLRDAVGLISAEAGLSPVAFDLRLSPALSAVYADPAQIRQAVLSLLRDGVAERPIPGEPPGTVVIATRAGESKSVEVAVTAPSSGSAPGLATGVSQRAAAEPEGPGAGLSISESVIAAHGGRLWVEREPARGVTIRFSLPTHPTG